MLENKSKVKERDNKTTSDLIVFSNDIMRELGSSQQDIAEMIDKVSSSSSELNVLQTLNKFMFKKVYF